VWGLRRRSCALSTCCAICCQALQTRSESDFHPPGSSAWSNRKPFPVTIGNNEQSGQTQEEVRPPRCEPQRNPQGLSPIGPEAGRRFATDLYGLARSAGE